MLRCFRHYAVTRVVTRCCHAIADAMRAAFCYAAGYRHPRDACTLVTLLLMVIDTRCRHYRG